MNRLINETDARGISTTYTHDENGNLFTVTNRRAYITTYEYDELNRKTKEVDPTGNYTVFTYDEESNLVNVTNARGYTTTYYYDELNSNRVIGGNVISGENIRGNLSFDQLLPETKVYNWPNPNREEVTFIRYFLSEMAQVSIKIFDSFSIS